MRRASRKRCNGLRAAKIGLTNELEGSAPARRASAKTGVSRAVGDELHGHGMRDDACPMSLVEKESHGIASSVAVIEGPLVDVHADKGVGPLRVEAACVLHRVLEGIRAMLKPIRDTGV